MGLGDGVGGRGRCGSHGWTGTASPHRAGGAWGVEATPWRGWAHVGMAAAAQQVLACLHRSRTCTAWHRHAELVCSDQVLMRARCITCIDALGTDAAPDVRQCRESDEGITEPCCSAEDRTGRAEVAGTLVQAPLAGLHAHVHIPFSVGCLCPNVQAGYVGSTIAGPQSLYRPMVLSADFLNQNSSKRV